MTLRLLPPTIDHDETGTTIGARLVFEDRDEAPFEPRYHFPLGWQLDGTASPFVPFGVAIAAWFGEDLVIEAPVRAEVMASATAAAPVLCSFAQQAPIALSAHPVVASPPRPRGRRATALFISRGVDSSVCLVLADQGRLHPAPDLGIIVSGIEPFEDADDATLAIEQSRQVTEAFGIDTLVVRTNLWAQVHPRIAYPRVHGSALFGIAHALSHHLQDVVIASALGWRSPALGSHRELDHLWSNDALGVHLLPADMERSERVRILAEDGRALQWLRVCWREPTRNCGQCNKCLLTAALLERYGALGRTPTFDRGPVDAEELRRHPPSGEFLHDLCEAIAAERPELANAARLSQDRLADPWRTLPELVRLRTLATLDPPEGERPVPWCFVGSATGRSAAAVAHATAALGPGVVWCADEVLARPVLERALSSSRFAVWDGPDDAVDTDRVLLALEHGARPVQIVGITARESLPELPPALAAVALEAHELPSLLDEPATVVAEMAHAFAAGGAGWTRRAS